MTDRKLETTENNDPESTHKPNVFMIMAGGTGGHVFPGIAIAEELERRGNRIHWIGTRTGMEAGLVPTHGFPISYLTIKGVRNKGIMALLTAPWHVAKSTLQAIAIMKKVKPAAVLGMGGFVSGPGSLAARILGIPLLIHEQNAVAGLTNRLSAPLANRILTGFPGIFTPSGKTVYTGNPVRDSIQPRHPADGDRNANQPLHLLILGGSRGAQFMNHTLPEALSLLSIPVDIWHQTGAGSDKETSERYSGLHIQARVTPFINDMAEAYQWADLVICRAGALTIAELANSGKPSILVPYPWHKDRQQFKNAGYLVKMKAAVVAEQSELNTGKMARMIESLTKPENTLQAMGKAALKCAKPDAAITIADICEEMAGE